MIKFILYLFFGLILTLIAIKKSQGQQKRFLLFAGVFSILAFVSSILHNAVYVIFAYFFGHDFWVRIGFGGDELIFFYLASFVFPFAVILSLLKLLVNISRKDQKRKKQLLFAWIALVIAVIGFVFCFV